MSGYYLIIHAEKTFIFFEINLPIGAENHPDGLTIVDLRFCVFVYLFSKK